MGHPLKNTTPSADAAGGTEIVLRESGRSRLAFKPVLVNNPDRAEESVKGDFVIQVRQPSGKWEDYKTLPLNNQQDREWLKLSLRSKELRTLIVGLDNHFGLRPKQVAHGGGASIHLTKKDVRPMVEQILAKKDVFDQFIETGGTEILDRVLDGISPVKDAKRVVEILQNLDSDKLDKVNAIVEVSNLRKMLALWSVNRENGDRDFWRRTFEEHMWVISQVFSQPVILLHKKVFARGKMAVLREGDIVEFLSHHKLAADVALIETGTPLTQLQGRESHQDIPSESVALSAVISQIQIYREELREEFRRISTNPVQRDQLFNPRCVVIAGSSTQIARNTDARMSFDLLREELKEVEVITYDELFEKIALLLSLLEMDASADSEDRPNQGFAR